MNTTKGNSLIRLKDIYLIILLLIAMALASLRVHAGARVIDAAGETVVIQDSSRIVLMAVNSPKLFMP